MKTPARNSFRERGRLAVFLTLSCASGFAFADSDPVATGIPYPFKLDTTGPNYAVKTAAEASGLWEVTYRQGETVMVTDPQTGNTTTLVEAAVVDGTYAWRPSSGGVWALAVSSGDEAPPETASFLVYYSAHPETSGAGTREDPVLVVDAGDLDASRANGHLVENGYFRPSGQTVIEGIPQPSGFAFVSVGDGVYQLVAAEDGFVFSGDGIAGFVDTRKLGPDRTMKWDERGRLAYSCDGWAHADDGLSTLTVTGPAGETSYRETGWGTVEFAPEEVGLYTVTLAADGQETLTARIKVSAGFVLVVE